MLFKSFYGASLDHTILSSVFTMLEILCMVNQGILSSDRVFALAGANQLVILLKFLTKRNVNNGKLYEDPLDRSS